MKSDSGNRSVIPAKGKFPSSEGKELSLFFFVYFFLIFLISGAMTALESNR